MVDHYSTETSEDVGDFAKFVRDEYAVEESELSETKTDPYGSWDIWNVIRTVCKYSSKLSVGKSLICHIEINRFPYIDRLSYGP